MPDASLDLHRAARWIICESSGRWATAVKRFGPQLMPPVGIPCVVAASTSNVLALLAVHGPTIILWESRPDSLVKAAECIIQTATLAPESLQLIACPGISDRQQIALAELPVAAFVRHPEDLASLKPMIQGYFARHDQLLDY